MGAIFIQLLDPTLVKTRRYVSLPSTTPSALHSAAPPPLPLNSRESLAVHPTTPAWLCIHLTSRCRAIAQVVDMHVRMIAEAGIGSIVYSWWGRGTGDANGDPTDEAIVEMMLDRCLEYGVTLAFHIEPYKGRDAKSVAADARFIFTRTHARTHARTHPSLPPHHPRPSVFPSSSRSSSTASLHSLSFDSFIAPFSQFLTRDCVHFCLSPADTLRASTARTRAFAGTCVGVRCYTCTTRTTRGRKSGRVSSRGAKTSGVCAEVMATPFSLGCG